MALAFVAALLLLGAAGAVGDEPGPVQFGHPMREHFLFAKNFTNMNHGEGFKGLNDCIHV
jgi:hypothetical protein